MEQDFQTLTTFLSTIYYGINKDGQPMEARLLS